MNYRFDKLGMINEGIFVTQCQQEEKEFFSLDEAFFAGKEVWAKQNNKERKKEKISKQTTKPTKQQQTNIVDFELLKLYRTNAEIQD